MTGFSFYKTFIRPLLFFYSDKIKKDPEAAHDIAQLFFKYEYPWKLISPYFKIGSDRLRVKLGGKVEMDGIFSYGAGLDKNFKMPGWAEILSYLDLGTFLPETHEGWNRPRTARDVENEAFYNRMGFPFEDREGTINRLGKYNNDTPICASVSVRPLDEDNQSPAIKQLLSLVNRLVEFPSIKMFEFNFSSPNTSGLQVFLERGTFEHISRGLDEVVSDDTLKFLKLPPYTEEKGRERTLNIVDRWISNGGDGVTLVNTLPNKNPKILGGRGGVSGRPLYPIMLQNLRDVREQFKDIIINACGGIWPENVSEVLIYADTIQFLTTLFYEGPGVLRAFRKQTLKYLDDYGYNSLSDLEGHHYR